MRSIIEAITQMPYNREITNLLKEYDLVCQDIHWSDNARNPGSCWGPNITDQTLEISFKNHIHRLPAIRYPNFTDKTSDVDINKIWLPTGNHKPQSNLVMTPLISILENPSVFMTNPEPVASMYNKERDSHVLVSAQVCFLPLPATGAIEFAVSCYAYQSSKKNPAQLVILSSQLGTSFQILDKKKNTIWHNDSGTKRPLLGERQSSIESRTGNSISAENGKRMSTIVLVQIPLEIPDDYDDMMPMSFGSVMDGVTTKSIVFESCVARSRAPDVENAIITAGRGKGKHKELNGLGSIIKRDLNYPIRVTYMEYKGSSNGILDAALAKSFHNDIETIYNAGEFRGSLVIGRDKNRPTNIKNSTTPPIYSNGQPVSDGIITPNENIPHLLNE